MRMIIFGLSAAALLAGCNEPVGGNGGGPVNMAGPTAPGGPGNMMGPGAPAGPGFPGFGPGAPGSPAGPGGAPGPGTGPGGPAPGGGGDRVQAEVANCVRAASAGGAPPSFNIQQYCDCAVNSAMSGTPPNEAIRQCAAQQGVQIPGQ